MRLTKEDVNVEEGFEDCGSCTGTLPGAGHWVVIDFRAAGMTERFGPFCEDCAENIASRIRDGLPLHDGEATPSGGHVAPPEGHGAA